MDIAHLIQTVAIYALPVVFAITAHEAAHGYAARYLGDDTAWVLGRVTLNPIPHIDLVGTILMPLLLFFATSGALVFGFAKPLPVRYGNLRSPKRDMVWVALAGPGSNFAMGLLWGAALYLLQGAGVNEVFFIKMCEGGVLVNVVMCVFNLFPLPPLDGGRVLTGVLPYRAAVAFSKIERWGFFIVMALVVTKLIDDYWMRPLMALNFIALDFLLSPLAAVLNAEPAP